VLVQADNDLAQNKFRAATEGYATVLRAEPRLKRAIDGLARARGALGTSEFQSALGSGLAALRDGKLQQARSALERARALNPDAPEVAAAFAQLEGRKTGISLASDQQGILQLETRERWADALAAYNAVLKIDASVEFARAGKARVTPHVELARRLQGLIDQPDRLSSPAVRTETQQLLTTARATTPSGPVLRSQISRLELLIPQYERPVRVVVESDSQTTLSLSGVGALGSFARRELELLPGKYTLTGTRDGYRDVRRELAVKPGDGNPAFELHCADTI
jgi:tetratricopeptide (TPR) repeat protein